MEYVQVNPLLEGIMDSYGNKKILNRMESMLEEIQREQEEISLLKKQLLPIFERVVAMKGYFAAEYTPLKDYIDMGCIITISSVEEGEWGCKAGKAYFYDDGENYEAICNVEELGKIVNMTFDEWIKNVYYKTSYYKCFIEVNKERLYV